jgi:hypothetical protein
MKKLTWFILAAYILTFPSLATSGLPPTRSGGQSDALSTTFDFKAPYSQVTKYSGTGGLIETGNYQLLKNPSFEATTYSSNWTASGGTLAAATSTNIFFGKSATWDSSSASQTLTSDAITVPEGFKANNCEASIYVKVPSGTATHTLEAWGGTNILATASVVNSIYFTKNTVTFPCPTSGTIALRLVSVASDEPLIALDDAYLGLARNVGVADLITEWRSFTPIWTSSGTAPVLGNGTLTGRWRQVGDSAQVEIVLTLGSTSTIGTGLYTLSLPPEITRDTSKSAGLSFVGGPFQFYDNGSSVNAKSGTPQWYTSPQRVGAYISGYGQWDSGLTGFGGTGDQVAFTIQYPVVGWQASTVVMPDAQGLSWSGTHASTCIWTTTSSSYADPADDASCTLSERTNRNFGTVVTYGAAKPGITFTPRKSGTYFVCARSALYNSTTNGYSTMSLSTTGGTSATIANGGVRQGTSGGSNDDKGVTLCGLVNLTSTTSTTVRLQIAASIGTTTLADLSGGGSSVEWSIFNVDQPVQAILANSVSTPLVSGEVIGSAVLDCDSSSSIIRNRQGMVASLTNISSGSCTVTLASNYFSASPDCTISWNGGGSTAISYITSSATALTIGGVTDTGSAVSSLQVNIQCNGPR